MVSVLNRVYTNFTKKNRLALHSTQLFTSECVRFLPSGEGCLAHVAFFAPAGGRDAISTIGVEDFAGKYVGTKNDYCTSSIT